MLILESTKNVEQIIPIKFYPFDLKLRTPLLWRKQAHCLTVLLRPPMTPVDSPVCSFHHREVRWAEQVGLLPKSTVAMRVCYQQHTRVRKSPCFCLSHSLWKRSWHVGDNLVCCALHPCHLTPLGIYSYAFCVVSSVFVCVTVQFVWKRRPPFLTQLCLSLPQALACMRVPLAVPIWNVSKMPPLPIPWTVSVLCK